MIDLGSIAAWGLAGLALGAAYLWLVARSVAALVAPGAKSAAGYLALRIGLAAGVFWMAALQGAGPLLAVLAGFLVARTLTLRIIGREPDGR